MAQSAPYSVDRSKLEEYQSKLRREVEDHFASWATRQFLKTWGFGLLILLSGQLLFGDEPSLVSRLAAPRLVFILIAALGVGIFMTVWGIWNTRRQLKLASVQLADRIEKEHAQLTGPAWVRHVLGIGLKLTLGVGLPVGALFSLLPIPATVGTRISMFVAFVGMTALWAMPFAFAIRWMSLRSDRRWQVGP